MPVKITERGSFAVVMQQTFHRTLFQRLGKTNARTIRLDEKLDERDNMTSKVTGLNLCFPLLPARLGAGVHLASQPRSA